MPLRQFLPKNWHMFELSIPRYLAPRVFEPWPGGRRSLHQGASRQEKPLTTSLDRSNDRKMVNDNPSNLDSKPRIKRKLEKRVCTSQPHKHSLATTNDQREARWRKLVLWLNKVTSYAIEVKKTDILLPVDWQAFRPRISDEEVNNVLTDVANKSLDWENRDKNHRGRFWQELMVKVLHLYPDKALDILEATVGRESRCLSLPCTVVADVIHCIILHHFSGIESCMSEEIATRIFRLQLSLPSSFSAPFSNHSLFLLMSNLPAEHLPDFYSYHFVKRKSDLSMWTLMQLTSKLAKSGETDLAFDVIKELAQTKIDLNRPNTLSVITSLLHESHLNKAANTNLESIFQYMVKCGLNPNVFTYNVLLHYITKIPDPRAAWELHNDMIKAGVMPDNVTYSILLNDAKQRLDSTDIKRVVGLIREHGTSSKYIVTDMLHAIFLLRKAKLPRQNKFSQDIIEPEPIFDQMLRLYSKHFKIGPLLQLIPWLSDVYSPSSNPSSEHPLWDPPGATICVMLTGFLDIVNSEGAKEFYDHFRKLVRTEEPSINFLLRRTYVYNVILMCYYRFRERAKDAPFIIADMLSLDQDLPNQALESINTPKLSSLTDEGRTPLIPVKPDVFTWSILVKIFMRLQYSRAAEKVLSMMVRRNIKPTKVTWTSLISGYSRMQNPGMVANALLRLEEAGYTPDEHIYRVISKIHQQDRLTQEIENQKCQTLKPVTAEWLNDLKNELAIDIVQKNLEEEDEF